MDTMCHRQDLEVHGTAFLGIRSQMHTHPWQLLKWLSDKLKQSPMINYQVSKKNQTFNYQFQFVTYYYYIF
jgi:hypothetical protein